MNLFQVTKKQPSGGLELKTFTGNPVTFTPSYSEELPAPFNTINCKCSINAIQEGTPWTDSNVIEKEPYNFRKVAGTASRIGNHLFDKLVGGTVAWNQTMKDPTMQTQVAGRSGTLIVSSGIATLTSDGTGNCYLAMYADYALANHVVFMAIDINYDVANVNTYSDCRLMTSWQGGNTNVPTPTKGQWGKCATIVKPEAGGAAFAAYCFGTDNTIANEKVQFKNPLYIDLTAMFGSTIADYIYSLEQATAGAGVAWFRKLFPDSYYAYDAGSLKSVKTTAHKMVGKNLLPNLQGQRTATSIFIGQTDDTTYPTLLRANVDYHLSFGATGSSVVAYYKDTNGNTRNISSSGNFSVSENMYVQMWLYSDSLTSVEWFQLELGSQATAYEPYTEHNYALDDVELRGLFKLDSNNKLYADGDTYESSGDVGRKYGYLLINGQSGLNYQPNGTTATTSNCYIPITGKANGQYNFMATRFVIATGTKAPYQMTGRAATNGIEFCLPVDIPQTNEDLQEWFSNNPVELVFELATPTAETADPFTNPQEVDANGTEEYIDSRSPAIPVGHETYYADIYDITGFTSCKVSVADGQGVERKSATVQFGQTVYGGVYDANAGKVTDTFDDSELSDITGWSYANGFFRTLALASIVKKPTSQSSATNALCSIYNSVSWNACGDNDFEFAFNSSNGELIIKDSRYTDVPSFLAGVSGVPFVYELATPIENDVSTLTVEALLGENRVSHNCNGNIEVTCIV